MAEEQEEQVQEKKSNSIVLIFIIGIIAFLIIIGAVLFFVLSGDEEGVETDVVSSDSTSSVENQQQQSSVRRSNSLEVGFMFELDTFIVNLLSENGRRYLKIKVNLELEDEDLAEEVTLKTPVIRDIVIRIASSKTLEEISTEKGKDKFKDQVLQEINSRMKDGRIQNIYFTDFVIQ